MNDLTKDAPSISSSAMLVDFGIGIWTGRKLDKKVSEEVDVSKLAQTRAGNYNKKLFPDEPDFDAISKYAGSIRTAHYFATMPWNDAGQRLLTTKMYFDYHKHMTGEREKFMGLVDRCLENWDDMLVRAERKLGNLFNPADYPSADAVRAKYYVRFKYSPVPEAGDFRCDIGHQALEELKESYEHQHQEQLRAAYQDVWTRTHDALKTMSTRLAGEDCGIFRNSLVSNVQDMVVLLDKFNITDDPRMRAARKEIDSLLSGVTPEALRESNGLRLDTKSKVDELLKQFAW